MKAPRRISVAINKGKHALRIFPYHSLVMNKAGNLFSDSRPTRYVTYLTDPHKKIIFKQPKPYYILANFPEFFSAVISLLSKLLPNFS